MLRWLAFLLMFGLVGWQAPVMAQDDLVIFVYDAWLVTEDGQQGTVYATIANDSPDAITLQGAQSAGDVLLTLPDAEPPTIAAGETFALTPDTFGLHVTAADDAALEQGVVLTLSFADEHDDTIEVAFAALPVDALPEAGAVVVLAGWARPTALDADDGDDPAHVISGAYLTLENRGETAETLVGVTSPVVHVVEIHETQIDGDIMRMRPLDGLTLEADERHALAPGGDHLMLIGLDAHLLPNAVLPLTLTFDSGLEVTVAIVVRDEREPGVAATEDAGHHGHH